MAGGGNKGKSRDRVAVAAAGGQLATARAADLVLAGAPKDVYYGQRWMLQETAGRSPASKWPTGRFTSDHLRAVCLKYGGSTSSPRI
ncbi:hypothetical protein TESG_08297 [Trichophyton tonsurans CBS 112818]|uniref:Uncharacterized protein n=1 Tax=Trichophyton tonsurans (strain CBS 112818) TaxID=647933 RepID=F2RQX8_TRIT1|nr:hypothetical protein TESG_08297 [Trichophyton tonsurans CBS 112818]